MSLVTINKQPSRRDLFWFGAMLPIFFALVGDLLIWKWSACWTACVTWAAGTVLIATYLLAPRLRRYIYLGWMYAALPVGWTVSCLLLTGIFYLVLTPFAWLMRCCGYDPLRRKLEPAAKSYWLPRSQREEPSRYLRQF